VEHDRENKIKSVYLFSGCTEELLWCWDCSVPYPHPTPVRFRCGVGVGYTRS